MKISAPVNNRQQHALLISFRIFFHSQISIIPFLGVMNRLLEGSALAHLPPSKRMTINKEEQGIIVWFSFSCKKNTFFVEQEEGHHHHHRELNRFKWAKNSFSTNNTHTHRLLLGTCAIASFWFKLFQQLDCKVFFQQKGNLQKDFYLIYEFACK